MEAFTWSSVVKDEFSWGIFPMEEKKSHLGNTGNLFTAPRRDHKLCLFLTHFTLSLHQTKRLKGACTFATCNAGHLRLKYRTSAIWGTNDTMLYSHLVSQFCVTTRPTWSRGPLVLYARIATHLWSLVPVGEIRNTAQNDRNGITFSQNYWFKGEKRGHTYSWAPLSPF